MTKTVLDEVLDAAFEYIANRGDLLTLCAGVPTSFFEATTLTNSGGKMVASSALTEGVGGGDFSLAAGTTSGRRLTIAARALVDAQVVGTVDHLAIVDQDTGALLSVTELTESVAMTPGDVVGIKSFSQEIAAPV